MKKSRHLEFKEQVTDSFLKTVSNFANYEGGEIVFGINDQGKIVGLQDLETNALTIEHKINDTIEPQVDFQLVLDRTQNIIRLIINSGDEVPFF